MIESHRIATVRILVPICLCVAAAWAAEPAEDDGPAPLVEYVEVNASELPASNTIATKLSLPLQMTPANVGVVPRLLFTEQDAQVLGDALLNVSGLNVQSGGGVHDYFTIRGFESVSSGLVMTDGVAEPEVTFYNLYNVEGVEVFKGPAGFLYGKNPLAGAINVVRKQPLAADLLAVEGSLGSFGTKAATVDWNATSGEGPLSFRINGFLQQSDGYRDDKESDHSGVNPALTWKFSEDTSLNVNYEYVDAEFSPDNGIPLYAPGGSSQQIPDVDREWSYQGQEDFSDQTLHRFQVDFETRLGERLSLRNKTYFRDLDWESKGTLLSGTTNFFDPEFQVSRDSAVLDDRQQFVGNQLELILSVDQGAVKHRVLAGLEIVHESDEYTFDVVPLADVRLSNPGFEEPTDSNPNPFPLTSRGDVTNLVIAPYVIDQMQLSERWQLLIGARYDDIDSEGEIQTLTFLPNPSATSFSRDDSKVSPMAGVVFAPDPSLSFYYNAGRSYAPPSTRLVNEQAPGDRQPEVSRQIELGTKKQFLGGKVRTTFSVYRAERENIAITDLFGFTQQAGDQRSRGFEVELAAEPAPGLRTFLAYAYNDSELMRYERSEFDQFGAIVVRDYGGNTPIMAPENLANLWVSKSFTNGLGVAGGARFVGKQFVDEDNLYEIDSSVTFDAAVYYDLRSLRFGLNLKNVTDAEYETRSIAGGRSVVPARPFSAQVSIGFRM